MFSNALIYPLYLQVQLIVPKNAAFCQSLQMEKLLTLINCQLLTQQMHLTKQMAQMDLLKNQITHTCMICKSLSQPVSVQHLQE